MGEGRRNLSPERFLLPSPTFPTPLKSLSPHASSAKLPRSKIEPLEGNAMKTDTGAIGVLGGVGPYAGLDLMRKIFDQTEANCDQEHLSVIQYSLSEHIIDERAFCLGRRTKIPAKPSAKSWCAWRRPGHRYRRALQYGAQPTDHGCSRRHACMRRPRRRASSI